MTEEPAVSVSWEAIAKRLEGDEAQAIYLMIKVPGVRGAPDDLLADITMAIERANSMMDTTDGELVWASPPSPSPKGPIVHLDWVGTNEQNRQWLRAFAGALSDANIAGEVAAAPISHPPARLERTYVWRHRLTAYAAYTLDRLPPHYPKSWYVSDSITREIGEKFVSWSGLEGAALYFSENVPEFLMDAHADVPMLLSSAMKRSRRATATFLRTVDPVASRSLTLSTGGQVNLQSGDAGDDWRPHLASLREFLQWHPGAVDAAFIQYRNGFGGDWVGLLGGPVPLPYVQEYEIRHNRPLWADYVPDANGVQLLTSTHLGRATDLSGWNVTQLEGQRYLVEARDLDAWFGSLSPSEEVLAKARRDFGAMIITPQVIASDVRGWPHLAPPPAS